MQIGDKIPEFSLLDQNGVKRSNKGLKSPLVLFFYPKDDTPGCTIEVCGFRDKYDLFKVLDTCARYRLGEINADEAIEKLKLKLTNPSTNQPKDLVKKYCSVFTPNEKIEF